MISDTDNSKALDKADVSKSVILPNELRVGNLVFADLYDEWKGWVSAFLPCVV